MPRPLFYIAGVAPTAAEQAEAEKVGPVAFRGARLFDFARPEASGDVVYVPKGPLFDPIAKAYAGTESEVKRVPHESAPAEPRKRRKAKSDD